MQSVSAANKAVLLAIVVGLGGCTVDSVLPERKIDYKTQARTEKSLEVPPDLTQPSRDDTMSVRDLSPSGSASYSVYAGERRTQQASGDGGVLPQQDDVRLERAGDRFWLVARGEPGQIWPRARAFWLENGFLLDLDNPEIGIMETTWAENRADIPQGPVRRLIGRVFDTFYSSPTRDRFRVRLERGQVPGTTEIFLTHTGLEEQEYGESSTIWRLRPRDPELEAEMLKRLMVYIGVEEQRAQQLFAERPAQSAPRARFADGAEAPALVLEEPFSRAWRSTGLALDRIGFNVQDRDRAEGLYYVRYEDPEAEQNQGGGFLSKLAFWRSEPEPEVMYQVHLQSDGAATLIQVRDREGQAVQSATGRRILTLLHEELN